MDSPNSLVHEHVEHSHAEHSHGEHSHERAQADPHAGHSHITGHDHDHLADETPGARLAHLLGLHHHSHSAAALDTALSTNARGIQAVKISLVILVVTALIQVSVVSLSGSVSLLADTIHNFSDALTAIPLWLAFTLAQRTRNQRYTYGYGRAEDLAGVLIVLMIFLSSLEIFREAIDRFLNPRPVENLIWVAAAAVIGFIGNESVAYIRTRVGRAIGSAALVADGLHARTDGLTSLGVLVGVFGVALGFPLADPLIAIVLGVVILGIVWQAARDMWYRLMDAIDPAVSEKIETAARAVPGVISVYDVSARWIGHRLRGELRIGVDDRITMTQGHHIAEQVQHDLMHAFPELADLNIHVDPFREGSGELYHALTAHHHPTNSNPNGSKMSNEPPTAHNDYSLILRPSEGIQIIKDITQQFGVETLEGKIGPLLQGVGARAHYIEMPPRMYLYEHPHPTEAIIYTVRGKWVSCTNGKRHLMQPGSLFYFGPEIAAGYEVPFDEPALILIFKGERGLDPDAFVDYLEHTLKPALVQENQDGTAFTLDALPADHPARIFAASLDHETS